MILSDFCRLIPIDSDFSDFSDFFRLNLIFSIWLLHSLNAMGFHTFLAELERNVGANPADLLDSLDFLVAVRYILWF